MHSSLGGPGGDAELQGAWGGVGSRAEEEGGEGGWERQGSVWGEGEERRGHLKKCCRGLNWTAFLMLLEKCR